MNRTLTLTLTGSAAFQACLLCTTATASVQAWSDYRFAPDALQEIDLASDTAWSLSIDGGEPRPIKVPGGGWNSDRQDPPIPTLAGVQNHVLYSRRIAIPPEAAGKVVKVLFGGCNYGAEVFIDEQKVAEHHAPMTPFEADLTALVEPGREYALRIKAYHRRHYHRQPDASPCDLPAGFDFPAGSQSWYPWAGNTKFAYGITGHVRLVTYPLIHIVDVFVRPSVKRDQLEARVWVRNATVQQQVVTLSGSLAARGEQQWNYPTLPTVETVVPAGAVSELTVGPVRWGLGPASYWWPNIPFDEDYRAVLHRLDLSVHADGRPVHQRRQQFGFVEHAEGPFYYTVNAVRYTGLGDSNSYGQIGEYDCWTETPCFQPPRGAIRGCPETWRRYQRIGFNTMRLSTSVPTCYMLETADEAGFLLIPEGGSWGNHSSRFHRERFGAQLQGMIRATRNHPCVARYSMANESLPRDLDGPEGQWRWLIDDALEADDTRPYVYEVNRNLGSGRVSGMIRGHAYRMQHYDPIVPGGDQIRGMGECAWATEGMQTFAAMAIKMRIYDWAYCAPWSWLNFWPNFLEGMSHERHPWKHNNHPDRRDGIDGWGSPDVSFVQRALHPYLVTDRLLAENDPRTHVSVGKDPGPRPFLPPRYRAGGIVSRPVVVFNGSLAKQSLAFNWEARWDVPGGELFQTGRSAAIEIEPGGHAPGLVEFALPQTMERPRWLYLVLESTVGGTSVFRDDHVHFRILPAQAAESSARFVGLDQDTRGNWQGRYGRAGYEVVGVGTSFLPGVQLDWCGVSTFFWWDPGDNVYYWNGADTYIWEKQTDDVRAPASADGTRVAACRHADRLTLQVEMPDEGRRVSLYYVDWDRRRTRQTFTVRGEEGTVLDRREVDQAHDGCYLTWKIRGCVQIIIEQVGGPNAVVSGVFLD